MAKLKVYGAEGAAAGDFDVSDALLVMDKGKQAVHDVVVAQLAGRRAGTASTLSKGEVAGSNRKPWKQKGTGRARAGYRQSPIWRGGGVAFGPKPRSYAVKVNRKVARLAFQRAFSEKVTGGQVFVAENLALEEGRTRHFVALMKGMGVKTPVLFLVDKLDRNFVMASRNVPGVEVERSRDVTVFQLLRYPTVVASRKGIEEIVARLGGASAPNAADEAIVGSAQ